MTPTVAGVQDFRWMAFVLNQDMRSFDVVVSIDHVRDFSVARADGSEITIRHFVFDEKGSLDGTGEGLRNPLEPLGGYDAPTDQVQGRPDHRFTRRL